jgi:rhamnogalacturonan endolyase
MEKLGRGVVAVPTSNGGTGRLVTWRLLGTDDPYNTTFDVLRNNVRLAANLKVTNYMDTNGNASSTYRVVTKVNGEVVDTTDAVKAWTNVWMKLPLDRPAAGAANGGTYTPNDCSVGDVDGDGEYEIFVKWDPSTAKDNSQGGVTDNVYIDCYKLDGTKLWRIDLGRNIRAGAHYTQFQVYDYDGDGKAEMMCKTAPGSLDGTGAYVNQAATSAIIKAASNTTSYVTSDGRINSGHEYLTVFDGLTGKAIHTIAYYPNRNGTAALSTAAGTKNWDTRSGKSDTGSYGNRGERYLAATAYIDGPDNNASAIFSRGYYTYAYIWAVSFDGKKLIPRWLSSHESEEDYKLTTWDAEGNATNREFSNLKPTSGNGSGTMFGNGNHNLSIVDVDFDGKDEILWGSAALNHDGTLRFATGFGHGDAIHVGQMIAGVKGYQQLQVHEEGTKDDPEATFPYFGWDLHDASTGEILYSAHGGGDNGRGMAAQLSANTKDWWFSSSNDRQQRSAATGEVESTANGNVNFRIYWDGDVQDELLDGQKGSTELFAHGRIFKYSDSENKFNMILNAANYGPNLMCNFTKSSPNIQCDLFGDWREEVVFHYEDDNETYLGIYSTNIASDYAIPTLMHDHTYRMGICWQNTAYNQPPHLGYNLAVETLPSLENKELEYTVKVGEEFSYFSNTRYAKTISQVRTYNSGDTYIVGLPAGLKKTISSTAKTIQISGVPTEAGDYRIPIKVTSLNGKNLDAANDTLIIHVTEADAISQVDVQSEAVRTAIYDVYGREVPAASVADLPKGIYVVRENTGNGVVTRKILKKD